MAEKPKQKRAVALRYDPTRDKAPKLVAKGKGRLADQILALARKNYVPVREDPNLVQVLSRLNLDQEIPPQVYKAVAAILTFLYRVNRRVGP
ncbi:MAG TPA: EscU/YscU/HrcU family type III secretion system export apparatus switch protein [Gemmata sp.]|jgi:flagellar biosynthesis protein|nr:EscU/YscU/HrcU family type III secretion system export apparatus switch protein [Gemmata sp.]